MSSELLVLFIIAMVAGVILFRLYTVLGRKTGQERQRDLFGTNGSWNRQGAEPAPADRSARAESLDQPTDPIARGLFDIKLADRSFEEGHFLDGAKAAYEMIVTAFAQGERATLKRLVSAEVMAAFDGVLREREQQKLRVEFTFVGFGEVRIVHAELRQRMAEITVAYRANFISATYQADGQIAHGDPKAVRATDDEWTFSRDVRSSDPNWIVIATHGDEA